MEPILIITSYPEKNTTHGQKTVGGANYTKVTLLALREYIKYILKKTPSITVLGEMFSQTPQTYIEKGILVKRIWQRYSLLSLPRLAREIVQYHRHTKIIVFEFELSMFGNKIHLLPLPLLVLFLKLLDKRVVFVFHQVIDDMGDLHGHLNIKTKGFQTTLLTFLLNHFYQILLTLATKSIVFDTQLKRRLSHLGDSQKIVVIPLGVMQQSHLPTQQQARTALGIPPHTFVLMAFGFIGWYKGTDWIVNAFTQLNPKRSKTKRSSLRLIIAGGPNPLHTDKKFYMDYVASVETAAKKADSLVTGFIPEDKIALYFQAANIIVFPYRAYMSTSGPFSQTLSYNKPFLLSEPLGEMLETSDAKELLKKLKLSKKDLTFALKTSWIEKVTDYQKNVNLQKKIQQFTIELARKRSWNHIAKYYYEEIYFI